MGCLCYFFSLTLVYKECLGKYQCSQILFYLIRLLLNIFNLHFTVPVFLCLLNVSLAKLWYHELGRKRKDVNKADLQYVITFHTEKHRLFWMFPNFVHSVWSKGVYLKLDVVQYIH